MLRVISVNVNGLRSAIRKGFLPWLARQRADVVCLQETRIGRDGVPKEMANSSWYSYFSHAEKPGYSGTAVLSRIRPKAIKSGFGVAEFDREGRYCSLNFGSLNIASVYAPSGSSGEHRQASKDRFLDSFQRHYQSIASARQSSLICGDINIAHTRKDLKNWSANQKNSGFLEHERLWMDSWLSPNSAQSTSALSWQDVFRLLNQKEHQYTWWSNRGRAWENNVGWRIDYQIATDDIAQYAVREKIYKDKRFSDHSPVIIDYDIHWPRPA